MDERYQIGMFEDDDYAEMVRRKGYKLRILDDVFIHHFDGGSFKKMDQKRYQEIFEENKRIYEEKWNKKWEMHSYRKGVIYTTNINTQII